MERHTLFQGELVCYQAQQGYRFSVDAVLAAHFCHPRKKGKVLELGCGCGVISLLLAWRHADISITALELQEELARLASRNVLENDFGERITVVRCDLRRSKDILAAGGFDLVVSNPPYRKIASGRTNLGEQQAIARHEIMATIDDVVRAASLHLKNRGRAVFVYPAARLASLTRALRRHRLAPKRMQIVYSYPGDTGRLVLVEAIKNGGEELSILPPFYIYQQPCGEYSAAMTALYEP